MLKSPFLSCFFRYKFIQVPSSALVQYLGSLINQGFLIFLSLNILFPNVPKVFSYIASDCASLSRLGRTIQSLPICHHPFNRISIHYLYFIFVHLPFSNLSSKCVYQTVSFSLNLTKWL